MIHVPFVNITEYLQHITSYISMSQCLTGETMVHSVQ